MTVEFQIVPVAVATRVFDGVVALWGRSRATLGLFPKGAFEERAAATGLLAAVHGDEVAGFITFRVNGHRATIVHLCVDESHRGAGLGRGLFCSMRDRLAETVTSIRATCRRDYEANEMWPRLGFTCVGEKPGRSKVGALLNIWSYDLRRPTLFSRVEQQALEAGTPVVIDAHVFFDLHDATRLRSDASKALVEDWTNGAIDVFVTEELPNEIDRHTDDAKRDYFRRLALAYPCIRGDRIGFEAAFQRVVEVMGKGTSHNDDSDRRHLAHAASAGATIFATRDTGILAEAPRLYDVLGLNVVHPTEVLMRLDELDDATRYRPARLGGSSLRHGTLKAGQVEVVARALSPSSTRADVGRLQAEIRDGLDPATPPTVVRSQDDRVLALVDSRPDKEHGRLVRRLDVLSKALGPTLVRHLFGNEVRLAFKEGASGVSVTSGVASGHEMALRELGFFEHGGCWRKVLLRERAVSVADLVSMLRAAGSKNDGPDHAEALARAIEEAVEPGPSFFAELERLVWPTLVLATGIPSWVVPIRPPFARELFDRRLADADLFGAREELALSFENVYYRSVRNHAGLQSPGRIFWYVSHGDGRYAGAKAIRAFSRIKNVRVGTAKELFRAYRHLGIYRWHDVCSTAGAADGELMAVRFAGTQALPPIALSDVQRIIRHHCGGGAPTFPSPVAVSDDVVRELLGGMGANDG